MFDLFSLEFRLILVDQLLTALTSLECVLDQGPHTLVLPTLRFKKLFSCFFLFLLPPCL